MKSALYKLSVALTTNMILLAAFSECAVIAARNLGHPVSFTACFAVGAAATNLRAALR